MSPRESSRERLITWAIFLGALLLCGLLLSVELQWNFGYDQGTFAYGGSAILKGARTYIDFWDIKPPNIFYTYALAFELFGESVAALRLFDFLCTLLTLSLIWFVTFGLFEKFSRPEIKNMWWVRLAAVFAMFAYSLSYLNQGFQDTAQCETFSLPLLLGSAMLVLSTSARVHWSRLFLSGALIGVSCFYKYPFGLFILLPLTIIWLRQTECKERLISSLFVCAGLFVALLIQAILLLPNEELQELWKITQQATLSYNRNNFSGTFTIFNNLRTSVQMFVGLWLALGAIGLLLLLWSSEKAKRRALLRPLSVLCVGAVIGFLIVQMQNKGYKYHYQVLLPWVVILIGAGMATLAIAVRVKKPVPRVVVFALLLIGLFLGTLWSGQAALKDSLTPSENGSTSSFTYIAGDHLTNYVLAHSRPIDRIFIFGFQPYVYWYTHRKPATRFLNTIHFKPSYVAPELRKELIDSLRQDPPLLFFVETGDHYTSQGDSFDDSRTTITKRYPAIDSLLSTRYRLADTVDDILAYRLR